MSSRAASINTPARFFEDRARYLDVIVHDTGEGFDVALVVDRRDSRADAVQLARFYAEWVERITFTQRKAGR